MCMLDIFIKEKYGKIQRHDLSHFGTVTHSAVLVYKGRPNHFHKMTICRNLSQKPDC